MIIHKLISVGALLCLVSIIILGTTFKGYFVWALFPALYIAYYIIWNLKILEEAEG